MRTASRRLTAAALGLGLLLSAAGEGGAAFLREAGREDRTNPVEETERPKAGSFWLGAYVDNRASAASARPDGSGTAFARSQVKLWDAFNADRARFLADVVFLTDREKGGSYKPVSMDYYLGMATRRSDARFQVGRGEALALDGRPGGGGGFRYWDARLALLFGGQAGAAPPPGTRPRPGPLDWSASLSAGWFFHNNTLPARLDGSGLAWLRYEAFGEAALLGGRVLLRGDADFVTDERRRRFSPADLDLSLAAGTRLPSCDVLLVRRLRRTLDGGGRASATLLTISVPFGIP